MGMAKPDVYMCAVCHKEFIDDLIEYDKVLLYHSEALINGKWEQRDEYQYQGKCPYCGASFENIIQKEVE